MIPEWKNTNNVARCDEQQYVCTMWHPYVGIIQIRLYGYNLSRHHFGIDTPCCHKCRQRTRENLALIQNILPNQENRLIFRIIEHHCVFSKNDIIYILRFGKH